MKRTSFYRLVLPALGIALMIFVGLQFMRPNQSNPPLTAEIVAPPEVKAIFKHSCYSWHSNERKLPWFDQMVPAYWIDVRRARAHLNFSEIAALPEEQQRLALFDDFNQIQLGAMPLPSYRMVHPNSVVTPEQLDTLRKYLTTLSGGASNRHVISSYAANREYVRWSMAAEQFTPCRAHLRVFHSIPNTRPESRSAAPNASIITPYALF
jgi:hypothetical protein